MRRMTFQLRPSNGKWSVYLVRVNGREVPASEQHVVYGPETAARAQIICDSLNRGLYTSIFLAVEDAVRKDV